MEAAGSVMVVRNGYILNDILDDAAFFTLAIRNHVLLELVIFHLCAFQVVLNELVAAVRVERG